MTDFPVKPASQSRIYSWVIFLLPALALTTRFGVGLVEFALLLGLVFNAGALYAGRRALYADAGWTIAAFALYFGIALVSLLHSGFVASGLDNPVRQLLAMLAIGLIVLSRPEQTRLWQGLILGSMATAALAMYQFFWLDLDRAAGFQNAIIFGDVALAMGLLALAAIPAYAGTRGAMLPYLAFLGGLCSSALSGTRGGWIAVPLACVPIYYFARRRVAMGMFVGAALCVGALAMFGGASQYGIGSRVNDVAADIEQYRNGNANTSIGQRLEMWRAAGMIIAEHPVFGVGRNKFEPTVREKIGKREVDPSVQGFHHAHNELLHAMATQGVIGGAALLMIYAAPLAFFVRQARRRNAALPVALAGCMLVTAYMIFGLTQVMFAHHVGALFYAVMIAVLAGLCIMQKERIS